MKVSTGTALNALFKSMNFKESFRTMTPEEIEHRIIEEYHAAEKSSDRIKALELLCKVKNLVQHGNTEKKDYREVIVGGGSEAGGSSDDR